MSDVIVLAFLIIAALLIVLGMDYLTSADMGAVKEFLSYLPN